MGYWMAVAQNQSREFASFEERKKLDDCVATARENAQKKYSDYRQKLIESIGAGTGSFVRIDPSSNRPEIGPDSAGARIGTAWPDGVK